jgi:hypothetical protein
MKANHGLLIVLSFLLIASLAFSEGSATTDDQNRLSGRIEFGVLGVTTDTKSTGVDSRYFIGLSDTFKKISDHSNERTFYTFGTGFLLFNVNYMLNDDTTLYVGTPFFDDNREGLTAGFERLFSNNTTLDVSSFYLVKNMWKDPYLTGVDRDVTTAHVLGMTIDVDGITGTELNVSYTLRNEQVTDDVSGDNTPDLRRSGFVHSLKTGYVFYLNDRFDASITPSIIFVRSDKDGKANSYSAFGTGLTISIEKNDHAFSVTNVVESQAYDKRHPIFNRHRYEMDYTLECFYTLKHLLKTPWYTRVGFVYNRSDSNITFFNDNNFLYGVSVGYAFN